MSATLGQYTKKNRSNSGTGRNILGTNLEANNMHKIRKSSGESAQDKSPYPNTAKSTHFKPIGLRANTASPKVKKIAKVKKTMPKAKTKMVLAPHRNPTNKKVRVIDRPGKPRPKNNSGSSRF